MRAGPRVRLFKREDSQYWHLAWRDASGRKHRESTGCTTKHAAEARRAERERELADPTHAAKDSASLGDALAGFLRRVGEDVKAGERSAGTLRCYTVKAGHLRRLFEHGGAVESPRRPFALRAMSALAVDDYISARRKETATDHTIAKELVTLRLALKQAARHGSWGGSLEAVMPDSFSSKYEPKTRALTPDEVNNLLGELLPGQGARVAFIVATSANQGESDRARREDVGASEVHIRGTKTTYRKRTVPIVAPWQRTLLDYALKHADGAGGSLFLPWTNIRRDLHDACARFGAPGCSPNDLRRTTGNWLTKQGVPPHVIGQGVMGHRDGRMVERVYGRMSTATAKDLLSKHYRVPSESNSAHSADSSDKSDTQSSDNSEEPSAQGRNRTSDTGIFSPPDIWRTPRVSERIARRGPRTGSQVRPAKAPVLTLPRRAGGAP